MSNAVENLKLIAGIAKAPLGIVPMHGLVGVSRVLEDSSVKYAPGNWIAQSCADAVESYDSAQLRHRVQCTPLDGIVTPETYAALDEDSGLPHIDHMIAGLLILRTLLVRDGVLPEDPGQGRRKSASTRAPIRDERDPGYRACMPLPVPGFGANQMPAEMVEQLAEQFTAIAQDDPDAERRARTEREIAQRADEARAAHAAKVAHDNRNTKGSR